MKICETKIDDKWVEVPFHGIFQYSDVVSPSAMLGGHSGGVIAYPVVLVGIDGYLAVRNVDCVRNIREDK